MNYTLSIKNIHGEDVIREYIKLSTTYTIDLSFLNGGIYFLNLQNDKDNYVSKILIQK